MFQAQRRASKLGPSDRWKLDTPVALFIFKRPGPTRRVFEAIARARPRKLLVVADGPRHAEEAERCAETRDVTKSADWGCEVLHDFSDLNMGADERLSSGLDWVFSQVDEAIVLEDDCLPSPSFFPFCEQLLDRYREDPRVMQISGSDFLFSNYRFPRSEAPASYYFTRYAMNWGWATWKRAWERFDLRLATWPDCGQEVLSASLRHDPAARAKLAEIFERVHTGEAAHWDYAWMYACLLHEGLSVSPSRNLVSNIGFGGDASHCDDERHVLSNMWRSNIRRVRHPGSVEADDRVDREIFRRRFTSAKEWRPLLLRLQQMLRERRIPSRIKTLIPSG